MGVRVFIVEDEALIAMEIRDRLEASNYEVCGTAARPDVALERIRQTLPDVILMDINLGAAEDGIDVGRQITADHDIPIIFLTAYSDPTILERAAALKPYGFLVKPFETRELAATIEIALVKHAEEKKLKLSNKSLVKNIEAQNKRLTSEVDKRHDLQVKLEQYQEDYDDLITNCTDFVLSIGLDGSLLFTNRSFQAALGYSEEECRLRSLQDFIHPSEHPLYEGVLKQLLSGEKVGVVDFTLVARDGITLEAEGNLNVRRHNMAPVAIRGIFRDITDRRRAERKIQEHQERIDRIIEASRLGYWDWETSTDDVVYSGAWPSILEFDGYFDAARRSDWVHYFHPDELPSLGTIWGKLIRGDVNDYEVEHRLKTAKGDWKWVNTRVRTVSRAADGRPLYISGSTADISEQKEAQEALKKSQALLNATGMMANVGGWEFNISDERVVWTDETYHIFDLPKDTPLSLTTPTDYVHPDDRAYVEKHTQAALEAGVPFDIEFRIISESGKLKWVRSQCTPESNDSANFVLVGTVQDVSYHKKTQEELQKNRQLLNATASMAKVGGWEVNLLTGDVFWTDETYRIYDYPEAGPPRNIEDILAYIHPDDVTQVTFMLQDALSKGVAFEFTGRLISAKGTLKWVNALCTPVVQNGKTIRLDGVIQDITHRHHIEDELQRSRMILNAMASIAKVGGWELDVDAGELTWTDEVYRIFEVPYDAKPSMDQAFGFLPSEERKKLQGLVERALTTGEPFDLESQMFTQQGVAKWVHTVGTTIKRNNKVSYLIGTAQDISERKRIEQELQHLNEELEKRVTIRTQELAESERRHSALLGNLHGMAFICPQAEDCRLQYASIGSMDLLGVPPEDLVSGKSTYVSFIHPDDRERVDLHLKQAIAHYLPVNVEYRIATAKGEERWVLEQGQCVYDDNKSFVAIEGLITDITDQKLTEQALRLVTGARSSGRQFLADLVEQLAKLLNMDCAIVAVPTNAEKNRHKTLAAWGDNGLLSSGDYPVTGAPCSMVLSPEGYIVSACAKKEHPDAFFLQKNDLNSYAGVPLFDSTGRQIGLLAVLSRRRLDNQNSVLKVLQLLSVSVAAEIERYRSEEKFQNLFEYGPDGVILVAHDGIIQIANERAAKIFGFERTDLVGASIDTLVPDVLIDQLAELRNEIEGDQDSLKPHANQATYTGFRKDGSKFPTEITLSPLTTEQGTMIAAIVRDMTERRALENQLRSAQKMEAIGQLTGGMAHDFNNILGVIVGNLELLSMRYAPGASEVKLVERAIMAAEKGAHLTQRLLAFARRQTLRPQLTDVQSLIEGLVTMLRRTLGESIDIAVEIQTNLWRCQIDPGQLESAVLNLAINARDAMPTGGRITIQAENTILEGRMLDGSEPLEDGQYIMIAVSDTGSGMPSDVKDRAFEPFFTTKEVGQGTGLGLSMVYGFAKQSGGTARIYSEVGHGTVVKIFLPKANGSAEAQEPIDRHVALPNGASEKILVVDDNLALRDSVAQLISSLGYQTIAVADGLSALNEVSQKDDIALILSDVILPAGMNGFDLVRKVRDVRPDLPVVMMSGFTDQAVIPQDFVSEGVVLLSKPFRSAQLAQALAQALKQQSVQIH